MANCPNSPRFLSQDVPLKKPNTILSEYSGSGRCATTPPPPSLMWIYFSSPRWDASCWPLLFIPPSPVQFWRPSQWLFWIWSVSLSASIYLPPLHGTHQGPLDPKSYGGVAYIEADRWALSNAFAFLPDYVGLWRFSTGRVILALFTLSIWPPKYSYFSKISLVKGDEDWFGVLYQKLLNLVRHFFLNCGGAQCQ